MFPFDEEVFEAIVCYYLLISAGAVLIIAVLACVYVWYLKNKQ